LDDIARASESLYILGDFFEFWIGDDATSQTSDTVANALRKRADTGLKTYFMAGNRDFLLGQHYADQAGIQLLDTPLVIDLCGKRALLTHGDELCTDDLKYQQFRILVRNPDWQRAFLSMPIAQRLQMAGQARSESQQATADKADYIMDVNPQAVVALMQQHQVNLLIHGHTHRPARHPMMFNGHAAERIVLGDWGPHGWLLKAINGDLILRDFPLSIEA
jgi:UDP-2,3-diacylglucosamine hydrolase